MDWRDLAYLGVTFGLFLVFALIVRWTLSRKRSGKLEEPKHRMLDDDD